MQQRPRQSPRTTRLTAATLWLLVLILAIRIPWRRRAPQDPLAGRWCYSDLLARPVSFSIVYDFRPDHTYAVIRDTGAYTLQRMVPRRGRQQKMVVEEHRAKHEVVRGHWYTQATRQIGSTYLAGRLYMSRDGAFKARDYNINKDSNILVFTGSGPYSATPFARQPDYAQSLPDATPRPKTCRDTRAPRLRSDRAA